MSLRINPKFLNLKWREQKIQVLEQPHTYVFVVVVGEGQVVQHLPAGQTLDDQLTADTHSPLVVAQHPLQFVGREMLTTHQLEDLRVRQRRGAILPGLNKNDIKMLSECLTLVGKPGNR